MSHKVLLLLSICLTTFWGCVGTVDSSKKELTKSEKPAQPNFYYLGIVEAKAIANDKIQIDFRAAGEDTEFEHYLYINNSTIGIKIELNTIKQLPNGLYRYILTNLNINTSYSLSISAIEKLNSDKSEGSLSFTVKTFDNQVANFMGINNATLVPGQSTTSALLQWNPATFIGGLSATSFDPVYYEVYYVSEAQGLENLFNSAVHSVARRPQTGLINTPAKHAENTYALIDTLSPGTTYYFAVRAIHKAYNDQPADAKTLSREANETYLRLTTDDGNSVVDFNQSSLIVQKTAANSAFNKVITFWESGEGSFTGYRMFVKKYAGLDLFDSDELTNGYITELDAGSNYKNLLIGTGGTPCTTIIAADNGVTNATLPTETNTDSSKVACFDLPTSLNSLQISGLSSYTGYHFKIALCRDDDCPLENTDPLVGILSQVKAQETFPVLTPFSGISTIDNPNSVATVDQIKINFNAVVKAQGYADTFELYCVNPSNVNQATKFPNDGSAISGSPIPLCNGLTARRSSDSQPLSALDSHDTIDGATGINIKNIVADGATNYCFNITPAITQRVDAPSNDHDYDALGELRLDPSQRVTRCISPYIKTPSAIEFPGITSNCNVSLNTTSFSWQAPSAGLFQNYTIFRKLKDTTPFNFVDAIADTGETTYKRFQTSSLSLNDSNLSPGETYEYGVLTRLISGGDTFYSETNTSILSCSIELPKSNFTEWTRIFATGPKIDGRVPTVQDLLDSNDWPTYRTGDNSTVESRIYEALNPQGQLYEVKDPTEVILNPPGEIKGSFTATSAQTFNGVISTNTDYSFAGSRNGIISLAWLPVTLDYLQSDFETQQTCTADPVGGYCDHKSAVAMNNRKYGYRIYRSEDNGSSWKNLTKLGESNEDERLVHTVNYQFRDNPKNAPTPIRMGFFTDYSVLYTPSNKDTDRARVYYYKIVPVFNGKELNYIAANNSHHIIRVTLPPPNMSLVHRLMANRSTCMEVGRYNSIDHQNFYRCDWNGLGSNKKGFPYQLGNTAIDQGSDLLVDRFELGCNFTRGANAPSYQTALSFYHRRVSYPGSWTDLTEFRGFTTDLLGNDDVTSFRGCVSKEAGTNDPWNSGRNTDVDNITDNPYDGITPLLYDTNLYGDCLGSDSNSAPLGYCATATALCMNNTRILAIPGYNSTTTLGADPGVYDPSLLSADNPQFLYGDDPNVLTGTYRGNASDPAPADRNVGLLDRDYVKNLVAQSEFGAVYYNNSSAQSRFQISVYGQGYSSAITNHESILANNSSNTTQACTVNFPSIDADGSWRARWLNPNNLNSITYLNAADGVSSDSSKDEIITKTVSDIRNSKAFYDNWQGGTPDYGDPILTNSQHFNTDRLADDMPVGRVMSSNSAKLPPLTGASQLAFARICSTYKVQVGIANDTGSFQAISAPNNKKLINRAEHIKASIFPEEFSANEIIATERGDSNDATNTPVALNGESLHACKSGRHTKVASYNPFAGNSLTSNYASSSATNRLYVSGSGRNDGNLNSDDHTENCQSRYGIQDMIGNVREVDSTQLFCDYDPNAQGLYFGKVSGGFGSITNSLALPVVNPNDAYRYYYKTDARICKVTNTDPDGAGGEWYQDGTYVFNSVTYDKYCRDGNEPWLNENVTAGYCSVVDDTLTRPISVGNFRDTSDIFHEILNPDDSINSSMVQRVNTYDPLSIVGLRNGDGRFLNFGSANMGPAFLETNSIAFATTVIGGSVTTRNNLYFSPIIGFPLSCADYAPGIASCDAAETPDNLLFSLPDYEVNHTGSVFPGTVSDDNYFIGNSSATSKGLSATRGSTSPTTITYGGPTELSERIIVSELIELPDSSVTMTSEQANEVVVEQTNVPVYQYYWDLRRDQTLTFENGGASSENANGRYSINTGVDSTDIGARCVVYINDDDF